MTPREVAEDMLDAVRKRRESTEKTGMRVPYHGPLCSAVPSVLRDVEWWANRILEANDANR
jgi:hypothetical protein